MIKSAAGGKEKAEKERRGQVKQSHIVRKRESRKMTRWRDRRGGTMAVKRKAVAGKVDMRD